MGEGVVAAELPPPPLQPRARANARPSAAHLASRPDGERIDRTDKIPVGNIGAPHASGCPESGWSRRAGQTTTVWDMWSIGTNYKRVSANFMENPLNRASFFGFLIFSSPFRPRRREAHVQHGLGWPRVVGQGRAVFRFRFQQAFRRSNPIKFCTYAIYNLMLAWKFSTSWPSRSDFSIRCGSQ